MTPQDFRRYVVYGPNAVTLTERDRALDQCHSLPEARQSARMRGDGNVIYSYVQDPSRPHVLVDERFEEVVYS